MGTDQGLEDWAQTLIPVGLATQTGNRVVVHERLTLYPLEAQVLLDADGLYRSDEELRALFEGVGALQRPRVIVYCGGGISATMDALALTRLGHPSVAVYDGSMSEWTRDPDLPMETGT